MSAVNILRQADAVHILTDGLGLDLNEGRETTASKVHAFAYLNAAIAIRGTAIGEALLLPIVGALPDYDTLKQDIGGLLRSCFMEFGSIIDELSCNGRDTDVFVAGWTGAGEPDSFVVTNHARYPDVAPFEPKTLGELSPTPADPHLMEAFWDSVMTRNPDCAAIADLDPVSDGLALMELQREHIVDPGKGPARSIVGKFAQLTTVRRDEITTRILRRW